MFDSFSGYCIVCLIRKFQESDFVLGNGKCAFQELFYFTIVSIANVIWRQLLMNRWMWEGRDDGRMMAWKSWTTRRTCPSIRRKRRIVTGKIVQHLEEVVNSKGVGYLYNIHYLLTYLLTPWCRVLLEKLAGLQLVKNTISITQYIEWESWKLELSMRFVDIMIRPWAGRSWVRISVGKRIFIVSERAIRALGSNQPLIPREPAFSSGGNAAGAWIWPLTTLQSRNLEWMEGSFIPPAFNRGLDRQTLF